jgi:ABC-type phosphate/phosphonate transport system permease subunit
MNKAFFRVFLGMQALGCRLIVPYWNGFVDNKKSHRPEKIIIFWTMAKWGWSIMQTKVRGMVGAWLQHYFTAVSTFWNPSSTNFLKLVRPVL